MPKISGIYLITCERPGNLPLYYVGQSQNVNRRFTVHRNALKSGVHANCRLQAAWVKYGASSFSFELLGQCEIAQLDELEQWFLDEMFSHPRVLNIASSAQSPSRGRRCSEATRRRISEARKGSELSPETRALLSSANKGKKASAQAREKMSAAHKGRPQSDAHRAARLAAIADRLHGLEGTCIKTGAIIQFATVREAESSGYDQGSISKVCSGKWAHHKGYVWRYVPRASLTSA